MGEKLQMKKEILRESGKEGRQIVGIGKKEISFSGWSRSCCHSGNQAHTITFLSPINTPGYPDASFADPSLLSSPTYTKPGDFPHSCHSPSYGPLPSHRQK